MFNSIFSSSPGRAAEDWFTNDYPDEEDIDSEEEAPLDTGELPRLSRPIALTSYADEDSEENVLNDHDSDEDQVPLYRGW